MRTNMIVAAGVVAAALAGAVRAQEKTPGFLGVATDAIAIEDSRTVIRVLDVVVDSPAERAGLRPGDLILALDGEGFPWAPNETPAKFRERVGAKGAGESLKVTIRRTSVDLETQTGSRPKDSKSGLSARKELLPDLGKLLDEASGEPVTVKAQRVTGEREVTVVLAKRPGTTDKPLPANASLRPDLEAAPLEPEAAFARRLISAASLDPVLADVQKRLDQDEKIDDGWRLKTVRYLKRDPLKLPGETRRLARAAASALQAPGLLGAFAELGARALDADTLPVHSGAAPVAPALGSRVEAHVAYAVARMKRARELVALATSSLTADERAMLERELPQISDRFRETIILHDDEDKDRWRRHAQALDVAARVDRPLLAGALGELAHLGDTTWLDAVERDVKAAEARGEGSTQGNNQGTHGFVLHESQTEVGFVVVGGSKTNEYRGQYALIIDVGGNDRYLRRTATARPDSPVGVAIDLDGDDRYASTEAFSQGCAFLGVALLLDRKGDDRYTTDEPFAQGAALCGAAALVDLAGRDEYRGVWFCQGSGFAGGVALHCDRAGDDLYEAGLLGQAFAGPGVFACLADGAGDDRYASVMGHKCTYGQEGIYHSLSQGASCGVRNRASGGVALLVDAGGNDRYLAGNFSQGGGYFFGLGVIADLGGGRDDFEGSRYAQGFAAHSALGALWDDGGDDRYAGSVGALQGAAWDLSATAFLEDAGDDRYDGASGFSLGASAHNGLSLFHDGGGKDTYRHPPGLGRTGPNDYHGGGSLSVFVDLGEQDVLDVPPFERGPVLVAREAGGGSILAAFAPSLFAADEAKLRALVKSR